MGSRNESWRASLISQEIICIDPFTDYYRPFLVVHRQFLVRAVIPPSRGDDIVVVIVISKDYIQIFKLLSQKTLVIMCNFLHCCTL